jgi:hypothetical protein
MKEYVVVVFVLLIVFFVVLLAFHFYIVNNENNQQKYINEKVEEMKKLDYNPDINLKKYLLIISCHCNSNYKYESIKQQLGYYDRNSIDIIVINSKDLTGYNVAELCELNKVKYYEIDNDVKLDFGKWVYILENEDIQKYDYIIFSNDSYLIEGSVNHFLNAATIKNVEIYGYNNSSQNEYHYQSYLFILKRTCANKLIANVKNYRYIIKTQEDVINNFEIKMLQWFETKDCFLDLVPYNGNRNIFFDNDRLYLSLKKNGLLPFTKIKRIIKL